MICHIHSKLRIKNFKDKTSVKKKKKIEKSRGARNLYQNLKTL